MPILDINDKSKVCEYDKFVKNAKNTNAMQDLSWGKIKFGWKQEAVYIEENGEIVAAMSVLLEKVPYMNSYLMYGARGPVCNPLDIELVKRLVEEVQKLRDTYNIFALKFDPEIKYSEDIVKKYEEAGFKVIGKGKDKDEIIQPMYNMILNIKDKTEDELLKSFSEKTRYNIRLSNRKGIEVYYSRNEDDLKKFYKLYEITAIRDKIGCRAYKYFEKMLEVYDEKHLRIYIAKHEEDYLSAAIALNYGGKLFYIYGASSNEKRNLMPNYAMQWEMIKWGIETNCKEYDFGGVIELDKNNGLFKFKNGFCKQDGITEFIGEITKVYNKPIYFIYANIFPKIKKLKRKIRKK